MTKLPGNTAVNVAIAAGLLCLLVYLRALACGFVNFDDPGFVLNNLPIRHFGPAFLANVFTAPYIDFWMPLTWISLAVDYYFWELNPLGYHLTNIVLHAVNAGLVALIADRVLRRRCEEIGTARGEYAAALLLATLLFGLHPLRVESVAWITERKDVLNGVFTLGSVLCYLVYADRKWVPEAGARTGFYLAAIILFALSLTAKSVSVVLPVMFLILDWFPLGRFRKQGLVSLLVEKLPFLALSLAVSLITIHFARQGELFLSYAALPFGKRVIISGNAVFEYLRLMLFPVGIRPFYLIPPELPAAFYIKCAAAVAITVYCLANAGRRQWLAAIWLLFILPLLPVLAFLQNGGEQAMAARFTYLPAIAPGIGAAFFLVTWSGRQQNCRPILLASIALLLVCYGGMTYRLIGVWDNTGTLWSRVLESQPIGRAYVERGMYYYSVGRYADAVKDLSVAIDIAGQGGIPVLHNLHAFRGDAYRAMGQYGAAVADLTAAIAIAPNPSCNYLRGLAFKAMGRSAEAAGDFLVAGPQPMPLDWY
ncbi:transmembrane and TPR repeat-containing protein 3 [Geobacter sp. OR-1]|uniref:tetratricopeptide repeat protein n=1 Tax=Geobacter sp. OR-1 TaxID=1266765 RepID=UPI000544287F|nr:tetratricopeptide repeat protein [Geobacter sp. OR-1]GAM10538.1 transmembrane and TPR repeat-containing protein 3 [Geobacter sp. OR-1]